MGCKDRRLRPKNTSKTCNFFRFGRNPAWLRSCP